MPRARHRGSVRNRSLLSHRGARSASPGTCASPIIVRYRGTRRYETIERGRVQRGLSIRAQPDGAQRGAAAPSRGNRQALCIEGALEELTGVDREEHGCKPEYGHTPRLVSTARIAIRFHDRSRALVRAREEHRARRTSRQRALFRRHSPAPGMRGVLIIEAICAGARSSRSSPRPQPEPAWVYFVGSDNARFKKPVTQVSAASRGDALAPGAGLGSPREGARGAVAARRTLCARSAGEGVAPAPDEPAPSHARSIRRRDPKRNRGGRRDRAVRVIGPAGYIGAGSRVGTHTVIPATRASENLRLEVSSIGDAPQDEKYGASPKVGDRQGNTNASSARSTGGAAARPRARRRELDPG